ncbi:AfsR/SARP family transcriptional regulator [Streptomyces sp. NPDC086080]|uniref:AfsR/SARP family transcriptional regulator n=1 Tax=Streptomyces sp. NPDC086080 TaxID=3365748 RepID=UPI0037D0EE38
MDASGNGLRFAVLGPVRAWRGERELDLGSPQQRTVLVALLLRGGRPATLGELIDDVWGEQPPAAAVSVLRTYVSRLRKVLEPGRSPAAASRVLVSVGDGYLARVPGSALDLTVLRQRIVRARALRTAGEFDAAAGLLHAVLDGWPEAALVGLPGPLAEAERVRLNEERLAVLESRIENDLDLGRHGEVIAELMSLTRQHPLKEQLCRLLMLALYRSGRQAEALEAFRATRRILVDQLGIEPGAALRELRDRMLVADAALELVPPPQQAPPSPSGRPPAPAGQRITRPAQLPADLPTFAGRSAELDRVRALLPDDGQAPQTVVIGAIGGMGGIGKTTLAVHWAHEIADRFPDGQLCINLRGFDPTGATVTPEEAIRAFLDALGVPPAGIPAGLDAQAALYRSLLAPRRVLILLDNARDAGQVRPLLPGSPGSLVIVTSRNRLTGLVAGEGAFPLTLDQLTAGEAHDLLARRLGAGRLAAEPEAAGEIITRCARHPLALAIVAAHAAGHPGFPLASIAEEVRASHGSLDAFTGGDDIATDVRAVFSWSYQALSVPAARLFRLLGLPAGPDVSLPAVAALAGLEIRETRTLLAELTGAHLVIERLPGRYTLHDLLRVYAAERLHAEDPPPERERAVERLLSWYLHSAEATYPLLTPSRHRIPLEPLPAGCRPLEFTTREEALEWCERERVNLVGAVHQAAGSGQPGIAWRLPAVLWGFFYLRSHMHDWLDTAGAGLAAARAAHDRAGEAQGLADTAAALRSAGRIEESIEVQYQVIAVCRELGDVRGRATAVGNLGDAYLQIGRFDKAVEYIRRGLAIDRALGSEWGVGIALTNLGDVYQRLGRFEEAVLYLEEALIVLRRNSHRWAEGLAYDSLGTVHHGLRHYDDAIAHFHRALDTHRAVANRWGEGHSLSNLGDVLLDAGRPEDARADWRRALEIFMEIGHPDAEKVRGKLGRPPEDGPGGDGPGLDGPGGDGPGQAGSGGDGLGEDGLPRPPADGPPPRRPT